MSDHGAVVTAPAEDVIVKKIRKLLRLTQSSNPHEAESARDEAQRLMSRHGLTMDDVEDNVIEPLDGRSDAFRREIVLVLAEVHSCSPVGSSAGTLAFKGAKSKALAAASAYRVLVQAGEACELDVRVKGSPEPVREAWHACVWLGLASRVAQAALDLKARRNVKKTKVDPIGECTVDWDARAQAAREPGVVTEAKGAMNRTNGIVDTNWLAREAHAAGERAFQLANLDDDLRAREGAEQTQKQLKQGD